MTLIVGDDFNTTTALHAGKNGIKNVNMSLTPSR